MKRKKKSALSTFGSQDWMNLCGCAFSLVSLSPSHLPLLSSVVFFTLSIPTLPRWTTFKVEDVRAFINF